jgi:hypothetical protein
MNDDQRMARLEEIEAKGESAARRDEVATLVEDMSFTGDGLARVVERFIGAEDPVFAEEASKSLVGAAAQSPSTSVRALLAGLRLLREEHVECRAGLLTAVQAVMQKGALREPPEELDRYLLACLRGPVATKTVAIALLGWMHAERFTNALSPARLVALKSAVRAVEPGDDQRLILEIEAAGRFLNA